MKKLNKLLFTTTLVCSLLTSPTVAIFTDISRDVWETSQLLSIASTSMNENITRGEFAKMLVATSIYKDDIVPFGFTLFVDVEPSHPYVSEIKICLENTWMMGYLDGHFRPEQTVTYEEASISILKLLGYETMSGQYPYAFTDKFESLFLNDEIDATIGEALTHKDCMQLFYNTLNTKTATGTIYASYLGLPLNADQEIDPTQWAKEDHKGPFTLQKGEGFPFVTNEETRVYRDDRSSSLSQLESYDIAYYHEKTNTVYGYSEKITGTLQSIQNPYQPTGILLDGTAYAFETTSARDKFSFDGVLQEEDKITLLMGEDGLIADAYFEHEVVAIDYTQGPFTLDSTTSLPFPVNDSTIYIKDDLHSSRSQLSLYDVCYYNAEDNTLWAYDQKITGRLTEIQNPHSPVAVTVAGTSYSLETKEVKEKFEAGGPFEKEGYLVTLLLGQDGQVADVVSVDKTDSTMVGIVLSQQMMEIPTGSNESYLSRSVTILNTQGNVLTVDTTGIYEAGRVVSVTYQQGTQTVRGISNKSLSGTVNSAGTAIGSMKFADNIEIFEISHVNYKKIFPDRLAGLTLEEDDVRYYTTNSKGEIDSLLLEDATGDCATFAFVTKVNEVSSGMTLMGTYHYLEQGIAKVEVAGNQNFGTVKGGAVLLYEDDKLKTILNLEKEEITWLNRVEANLENGAQYQFADELQVYELAKDTYNPTTLHNVSDLSEYQLTAYYDEDLFSAGNQIRVILAERLDAK